MFPKSSYLVATPRLFLNSLKTSTGPFLKKVELPPSVEIWGGTPVEGFLKTSKTAPPCFGESLNTSASFSLQKLEVTLPVEIRGGTQVEAPLK